VTLIAEVPSSDQHGATGYPTATTESILPRAFGTWRSARPSFQRWPSSRYPVTVAAAWLERDGCLPRLVATAFELGGLGLSVGELSAQRHRAGLDFGRKGKGDIDGGSPGGGGVRRARPPRHHHRSAAGSRRAVRRRRDLLIGRLANLLRVVLLP
jgi:hypothetical protein